MNKSKVIILTQSVFGGNYGGILQAYALQRAISDLGLEVKTQGASPRSSISVVLSVAIKNTVKRLLNLSGNNDYELVAPPRIHREIIKNQLSFINQEIQLEPEEPSLNTLMDYGIFVVGSDQVWRAAYSDIPTNFLSFTEGRQVKRISYAASFGKDQLEGYSQILKAQCSEWLANFDGISVRETSAVDLCQSELGARAVQVLDPTMLFTKNDYAQLLDIRGTAEDSQSVFSYVLDGTARKKEIVDKVAAHHGLIVRDFLPRKYSSVRDYQRSPEEYQRPSVAEWLQGIHESKFVVTDSFHGTVFAILLNKPFLAIGNTSRGNARFLTILESLRLESRLVSSVDELTEELIDQEIDWNSVENLLMDQRDNAWAFLRKHLAAS